MLPFKRSLSQPTPSSNSSSHPLRPPAFPVLSSELPSFIKPTPARIPSEDIEFLAKKGATAIPPEPLRSELLKCYFNYVHPFMPLLDEVEWQRVVSQNWDMSDPTRYKDERISLL